MYCPSTTTLRNASGRLPQYISWPDHVHQRHVKSPDQGRNQKVYLASKHLLATVVDTTAFSVLALQRDTCGMTIHQLFCHLLTANLDFDYLNCPLEDCYSANLQNAGRQRAVDHCLLASWITSASLT